MYSIITAPLRRLGILLLPVALLLGGCSHRSLVPDPDVAASYRILNTLDGEAPGEWIVLTRKGWFFEEKSVYTAGEVPVVVREVRSHTSTLKAMDAREFRGGIRMVLAFQLAEGRTADDFMEFKKLDLPWVVRNNGYNRSTVFTRRSERWPFDAFEDVTFASEADFRRAYLGNEELAKAGDGLFGPAVFVAIVEPVAPTPR